MSERVAIALGSNVGPREAHLAAARSAIASLPGMQLIAAGTVEETAPFGAGAQGPYLNQMLLADTRLPPLLLLHALQRVEWRQGRVRARRWGARTIDLDIVRYGSRSVRSRELVLPHPGIAHRDFWRRELAELQRMAGGAR